MSREMKDSGIPWIGEIPKEWRNLKFKYSGSFQKGKLPNEFNVEGNGYPIIGASEMLGKTPRQYSLEADLPVCDIEDILILWDGANAGIVSTNHKGIISSTTVRYSCVDKRCSSRYVFYLFKSVEPYFREKVFGTTIPHMNMEYINEVPLLLPTLAEQRTIAEFLDRKCGEIDELVDLQDKMIEELKAYKQSIITETVTKGLNPNITFKDSGIEWIGEIPKHWKIVRLSAIGSTINGISKNASFFGEGFPFVSYKDVYNNYNLPKKVIGLVNSTENEQKLFSVRRGDVFFTRTSETIEEIGFSSVCLETISNAVFAGFLIRFRPISNKLEPHFSKFYFRAICHRNYFVKEMNLVTRASLSQNLLKSMPVLLPPLSEQQKIADYLDKKCSEIDSLIELKQQKIEELKDYKKSIIYEYVTGKKQVS